MKMKFRIIFSLFLIKNLYEDITFDAIFKQNYINLTRLTTLIHTFIKKFYLKKNRLIISTVFAIIMSTTINVNGINE